MDEAFTPEQCGAVVALGDSLQAEGGALAGSPDGDGAAPDSGTDLALRRSRVAWISRSDQTAWLFDRLSELVVRANRTWRFDLSGFDEELQYTLYDEPGAFYTWHQDGLDGDVASRKLALVVQLTDPSLYDGADLEMFDVVTDWETDELAEWRARVRSQGTVVAFPAFEYHRVTPLVSGRRASLVAWVGGPPFR